MDRFLESRAELPESIARGGSSVGGLTRMPERLARLASPGEANVATTIDVYGGEFDKQRSRRFSRSGADYGNLMETAPRDRAQADFPDLAQEVGVTAN
ncbi:MAG TPA: hypothetical protein VKB73_08050 [Gaiellaceae bacterium]|nr:hypothetical protein [Gaiellaceae bacterium]